MFTRLRLMTAGESHGPKLTAIIDGFPAGFPVSAAQIDTDLARRQVGLGAGPRMRIEKDRVRVTGGVVAGRTTGAPVGFEIANLDYANWANRDIAAMTVPRPGHADLVGAIKHGHRDLRHSLERASARETAARVAAGAICKQALALFGIEIGGYVWALGRVQAALDHDRVVTPAEFKERFGRARADETRCPEPSAAAVMRDEIVQATRSRDTIGGVVATVALGVPPGLGSYNQWDMRMDGRIAQALMSIPSVKGIEIGSAFANAARRGTEAHDEIFLGEGGALIRRTNRCGGIEAGVTNGMPIVAHAALKPIASTLNPLQSVDLALRLPAPVKYERSDICAVPRAVPIAEAMLALVVADALFEKLGGDSLMEMGPRFLSLRKARLDDLPMDNHAWRFGYPDEPHP